ncbi:LysR family transcriptional regulator [Mucilaginibacter terrae]|uniref:DNA-binding transcriptional LysR family regulator n=1 Tax=Mucilaginibacter terrae TaxID=1955052 RepID=A0ABU3GVS5_9SPHI|nr:LysR family transcriptional regulator [Mucilaginibacter terrae]MDT3403878.1 DNA-binding transcriptional LysR family regulator [Mucilaginibacter terrae]
MLSLSHQVFLEVATHLSFSKAAKALYISQPAISRHIKVLEEQYHFALFERNGNHIKLTATGQKIFAYLQEAREIERKIDYEVSISRNQLDAEGSLKLGASTTVALYIIPKILSEFHKALPQINIQLVNRNTENITNALHDKLIDVAIVEVESKLNTLQYEYFTTDKVIAVCAATSPIAARGILSLPDLLTIPLALRENGSGTLSALSSELKRHSISIAQLNTRVRLGGTEALKNFILEDLSLGFLPQRAVLKELDRGELVEVQVENLQIIREFFFITRKGDNFSLNKNFIRFAKNGLS